MTNRNDTPIACTLTGGAFRERVAWIRHLNQDGLQSHERTATSLALHYATDVRERVYQLVRQEAECCGFLMFAVDDTPNEIRVTITVPDRAREVADQLFEPFLPANGARPSATGRCGDAGGDPCCD